jgi:hypothetical protein
MPSAATIMRLLERLPVRQEIFHEPLAEEKQLVALRSPAEWLALDTEAADIETEL